MSVSELCQSVLEYVAETGKIPVKRELLSEEDRELIRLTLERLTQLTTECRKTIEHKALS